MPLTTNFKNRLLNAICGKQNFTNSIYAALSTTDPASGTFTEPSAGSYKRVLVAQYVSSGNYTNLMGNAENGTITNNATIYFPEVTEDDGWGTVTHVVLCSGGTKGANDMFGYASILNEQGVIAPLQINKNTVPLIRASKFTLGFVDAVAPSTPAEE